MNSPARVLPALLALFIFAISANAADAPEIRAGSELNFRPYCFTDKNGQATGFGVDLLRAVAEKATLRLRISPGEWDKVWNRLVDGEIDVLPVVARTPGREGLVEFTLPHTETFDAFFVRAGRSPIKNLAAAAGKEVVVLRSDAAQHQLVERKFPGKVVPVDSISEGLRLIASGKHDALLCSRLIGVLERDQAGIKGVTDGPLIPDYKRVFSFAVRKGNTELAERLNQGLRLVQADGTYDRLYRKWLGVEMPQPTWQAYFWRAIGIVGVLVLFAVTWVVARKALESDRRRSQALTPQPRELRLAFWQYALAVVAVAAAYAVRFGLEAWVGGGLPTFITFYPAVMVAALLGGIGPGLLATALTAVIAATWIMPPIGQLGVASPVHLLAVVLFCSMGLFMTAVAELHRRNRAKAAAFDREESLRETRREKEFLANLLEAAEQPFAIGYPDGRLGLMNRAYEQLTGYTAAELLALDWSTVLTPPEWRDHERQKLEELHRTGQPVRYEKEFIRKDGTRVAIELLVNLRRDAAGRPEFYYSFITDITERKQAQEALRESEASLKRAQEIAHLGSWELDLVTNRLMWSDEVYRIFGLPPREFGATYEAFLERVHPDDRAAVDAAYSDSVRDGRDSYEIEHRVVRKDSGEIRHVQEKCQHVRDANGRIVLSLGMVLDITDRKRAEEALRNLNITLEQTVQERTAELSRRAAQLRALAGELTLSEQRERSRLAKVLHDHLQQLLVAAKFRTAVLCRGGDELLRQATKEIEELIDECIAASRSLTAELSPPILHEAGLSAGLQWLARRMADRHGLLVDLELEEIPPLPNDLKVLLFESVRELLFNVVKHAHARSSVVSMRRVDGLLQLTISDQGIGFDPNVMSKAGESGRGFGLFSVRERLELFGGTIEIQSSPGQGSRIFLTVPMLQLTNGQPTHIQVPFLPEALVARRPPAYKIGRKIRILLADDHAVVRRGMADILGDEPDFDVVGEAEDGQEALELARKLLPDVILMDLNMPRLNGVEATRVICNEFPEIRIIGLSMFEEAERAQAMRDAGAVCYLTKSGAAETLIGAIRKHGMRDERLLADSSLLNQT